MKGRRPTWGKNAIEIPLVFLRGNGDRDLLAVFHTMLERVDKPPDGLSLTRYILWYRAL